MKNIYKIFLFSIIFLTYSINSYSKTDEELRQEGLRFIKQYIEVDNTLKGGTGKSKELLEIISFSKENYGHDIFTETWNEILEYKCKHNFNNAPDMSSPFYDDFIKENARYYLTCYKDYIVYHWNVVSDSIELRYRQIQSPNFLKDFPPTKKK